MEKPTTGALAASSLSESEHDAQSQAGTTGEDTAKSPGTAATLRARAKLAKVHYENGLKYRRGGDGGRALVDFLKATREDPKLVEAYYEQALIFREKGFHKLAVSRLEQALAIKNQYQKARLLLATIKLEQGNVSDAVEQLGATLGLPKNSATAIKPDAQEERENKILGVPPMILQSVHTAIAQPKQSGASQRHKPDSNEVNESSGSHKLSREQNQLAQNFEQDEEPTLETASPKASSPKPVVRRKKPGSRRKVRELMARKYGKNKSAKKHERMSWIAKIFAWPEPFRFQPGPEKTEKIATDEATDDELQQRGASNLVAEFQADDKEKTSASDAQTEEDFTPHFPKTKKNLLAYNGDPVDTIDLVREKITEKKEPEKVSTRRSPSTLHYEVEQESSPKANSSWTLEKIPSSKQFGEETKRLEARENELNSTSTKTTSPPSPTRKTRSKSIQKYETEDSETGDKTFALSARQVKIASKGLLDFDAGAPMENPVRAVEKKVIVKPPPAPVEDEWTRRLRYLAENGTSSLKPGEAFMFSEDTGEAVLFTNNGQRIRRVIAAAQETQEVLKLRRPDVLVPKELFYNTALLGKVVNAPPPNAVPAQVRPPDPPSKWSEPSERLGLEKQPSLEPPGFKIEQMMDNPTGFWNWFKGLVNL